jgi:hypothetical protein
MSKSTAKLARAERSSCIFRDAATKRRQSPDEAYEVSGSIAAETVLVVEDDGAVREYASDLLRELG